MNTKHRKVKRRQKANLKKAALINLSGCGAMSGTGLVTASSPHEVPRSCQNLMTNQSLRRRHDSVCSVTQPADEVREACLYARRAGKEFSVIIVEDGEAT